MSKQQVESCKTCKHFRELVGLGKPHPLRCIKKYHDRKCDHLMPLPEAMWCLEYESEDGVPRSVPMMAE